MIDHFNLPVSNLEKSSSFYQAILKPLGISVIASDGDAIGFGIDTWQFGIVEENNTIPSIHLAFSCENRKTVDEFYRIALASGGRENGPPGLRVDYGQFYFAAYVLDPDRHNIEAVCRKDETAS